MPARFRDMENNGSDQNRPEKRRIRFRRIRPRYRKILIPFLILSLIVAVILIWITNKYFFRPIFEGKGSIHQGSCQLVAQPKNETEARMMVRA